MKVHSLSDDYFVLWQQRYPRHGLLSVAAAAAAATASPPVADLVVIIL
jgi:hypothetical protein